MHGHTHARDRGPDGHQFHVGIDAHDYAPIAFTVIDAWIQSLPGIETRLETAVRDARQIVADLDSGDRPGTDSAFYVHGYNELRIALDELLDALGSPVYSVDSYREDPSRPTTVAHEMPSRDQEGGGQ